MIGLLVLGGFWLINDAYDDGFRDALVQSGQTSGMRRNYDGPDFPWGLVILGGIGYVAWRKGAFDRFGGPGGPFNGGHGHGQRGIQHYGSGANPSGQGFNPGFRGPRAFFDEWHRQAHEEAARAQYTAPPAPPAPPAPTAGDPDQTSAAGASRGGVDQIPPPTPPAPEYWASMGNGSETAGNPGAHGTSVAHQDGSADGPRGTTGTLV